VLDASVVLSKGTGQPQRIDLSPALPEIIVDGAPSGATLSVIAGSVLTATIDNTFTPGTWSAVSGSQAIASGRRAFKLGGPGTAPVSIAWT
jgi:hypothetical protein